MTGADLIWTMWRDCLIDARAAGGVPAEAVQSLITVTSQILARFGCAKRDADFVLYDFYTRIHWDWREPTDRVFETLLEFELQQFFSERGMTDAIHIQ